MRALLCWSLSCGSVLAQAQFAELGKGGLPPDDRAVSLIALGDLDGDGDLDALSYSAPRFLLPPRLRVLRNEGPGVYHVHVSLALDVRSLALGDADGDGDLDVFLGQRVGSRLFLNDGAMNFVESAGGFHATAEAINVIALGDVDGDGDLDVITGNGDYGISGHPFGQPARLYRNGGGGRYALAAAALPGHVDFTTSPKMTGHDSAHLRCPPPAPSGRRGASGPSTPIFPAEPASSGPHEFLHR